MAIVREVIDMRLESEREPMITKKWVLEAVLPDKYSNEETREKIRKLQWSTHIWYPIENKRQLNTVVKKLKEQPEWCSELEAGQWII